MNYHTKFQVCTLSDASKMSKMLIILWYKVIKYKGWHDAHTAFHEHLPTGLKLLEERDKT
jgi:hypothetical protein